jgi:hypothetical protein
MVFGFDGMVAHIDELTRSCVVKNESIDGGEDAMREIKGKMLSILEGAPSDASISLFLREGRDGYDGLLKIFSNQRQFVAARVDRRVTSVLNGIFEDLTAQLEDWRRGRDFSAPDPL